MVSGPSPPLHCPGRTCCPAAETGSLVLAAPSDPAHVVVGLLLNTLQCYCWSINCCYPALSLWASAPRQVSRRKHRKRPSEPSPEGSANIYQPVAAGTLSWPRCLVCFFLVTLFFLPFALYKQLKNLAGRSSTALMLLHGFQTYVLLTLFNGLYHSLALSPCPL